MQIIAGIIILIALIIGCILDPGGAINSFICFSIDIAFSILPSTPENLKISSLANSAASYLPGFGSSIIYSVFSSASQLFIISIIIKIYKLIPFKAS